MRASVVVPTRDRQESLERLLRALDRQRFRDRWELIVCDDGSRRPVTADVRTASTTVLRLGGDGPARARNAGWRAAAGEIVVFTDDDTEPSTDWVQAAIDWLDEHPRDVGVEGPVSSPPWDPLRAMSVASSGPGGYLTANIAFRRRALEQLDGFSEDYPHPHCEDYDLAYRALRLGEIGFAPAMRVVHAPRAMTLRQIARRGRYADSEMLLFARHRRRYGRMRALPARAFPLLNTAYAWIQLARRDTHRWRRAPARPLLIAGLMTASMAYALASVVRAPPPHVDRSAD